MLCRGDGPFRRPGNISRSQQYCIPGLFQFCSRWKLSGDIHLLPLRPCPISSLLHLFLLVLASLPFPTHDSVPSCLTDSDLLPVDLAVVASLFLLPICLRPITRLPSALSEEPCQKIPLLCCLLSRSEQENTASCHFISRQPGRSLPLREGTSVNYIPRPAALEEIACVKSGLFSPLFSHCGCTTKRQQGQRCKANPKPRWASSGPLHNLA